MSVSFLSTASKRVTDVRSFLREAAGGNSIKYSAEPGKKHLIYFPYQEVTEADEEGKEVVVKHLVAISGAIHEWQSTDGKYKATVCMKDIIRKSDDGEILLNDGECPFCNRVSDGWDIYRYRKELEESTCKLTGEDRKKHLEKAFGTFGDERKAKDARTYMYLLVVKYRQNGNDVVMGTDGLPEYDLKVMKLSQSRIEKIQQQIANAGADLPGAEVIFEYPNSDDRRLQISQSTTAPVFPSNMLTQRYPALVNKINEDIKKFQWEGIEKSFAEWNGMTTVEAKKIMDAAFEQWDRYKKELAVNPTAKYLEYITDTPVTNPQLSGASALPGVQMPGAVPGAAIPGAAVPGATPAVPGVTPDAATGAPAMPGAPTLPNIPDANAVFSGAAGGIQI